MYNIYSSVKSNNQILVPQLSLSNSRKKIFIPKNQIIPTKDFAPQNYKNTTSQQLQQAKSRQKFIFTKKTQDEVRSTYYDSAKYILPVQPEKINRNPYLFQKSEKLQTSINPQIFEQSFGNNKNSIMRYCSPKKQFVSKEEIYPQIRKNNQIKQIEKSRDWNLDNESDKKQFLKEIELNKLIFERRLQNLLKTAQRCQNELQEKCKNKGMDRKIVQLKELEQIKNDSKIISQGFLQSISQIIEQDNISFKY